MEILLRVLSWDYGDGIGAAIDGWWPATHWFAGIAVGLVLLVTIWSLIYAYVMEEKLNIPFIGTFGSFRHSAADEFAGVLMVVGLGVYGLSGAVLLLMLFWEFTLSGIAFYGLLRTARGVVRLKKQLKSHAEDKDAHK